MNSATPRTMHGPDSNALGTSSPEGLSQACLVFLEPESVSAELLGGESHEQRAIIVQGEDERTEEVLHRILVSAKNLRASGAVVGDALLAFRSPDQERFNLRASVGTLLLDLLVSQPATLQLVALDDDERLRHQLFELAEYLTQGRTGTSVRMEFPDARSPQSKH